MSNQEFNYVLLKFDKDSISSKILTFLSIPTICTHSLRKRMTFVNITTTNPPWSQDGVILLWIWQSSGTCYILIAGRSSQMSFKWIIVIHHRTCHGPWIANWFTSHEIPRKSPSICIHLSCGIHQPCPRKPMARQGTLFLFPGAFSGLSSTMFSLPSSGGISKKCTLGVAWRGAALVMVPGYRESHGRTRFERKNMTEMHGKMLNMRFRHVWDKFQSFLFMVRIIEHTLR